ncbi:MAG TPA: cytochrome P450 [Pyrinomonadaceae bacterium]|jgi:cytochrome P450|nr:cytochrome P450 [Pyrinomonadaceae bacterium]
MNPRLPPGPKRRIPGLDFIAFRRDSIAFIERLARYGDISYFRMGPQDVYFLNHPDYVKDVLVTHQQNFTKGRALQRAKRLLGEGLLTSEGDFHRRQRRLAQPAFHRQQVASYASMMTTCAEQMRESWRDRETLDMSHEMMRLTLAIVGKTLFDADVEAEADEIGDALTDIVKLFNAMMLPFSELLEKLPLPQKRRFQRAKQRLDATIYRMIEERRLSGEDRGDLLSMLLEARDEEADDAGMTDEQVRDEALTIFLAGHETTANALSWTWYLLSQHPEAEARLHAEIDEVLGDGRLPTFEDVAQLRYTEMVFAESMRLYPPAWAIGRLSINDYEIGGYTMRPRSLVIMSPYVMQRDPRYFPDPMSFDPERWTPSARESRPQFSYFPFGGGARRCIGEGFARMEGVLLIATLAQRWRFRHVPTHRVALQPAITLRPKNGMLMTLERRPPRLAPTDEHRSEVHAPVVVS